MKKALSLLFAFVLCFSLTGCMVKIEYSPNVAITIPAQYVLLNGGTEEEFIASYEELEGTISASFNADGSFNLIMTEDRHNLWLQEIMDSIDADIATLVEMEKYSFSEITYNSNLTEFNVVVNVEQCQTNGDVVYIKALAEMATFYHIIRYVPEDVYIVLYIIDEDTGEIVDTARTGLTVLSE
jgi:hypothetical protein